MGNRSPHSEQTVFVPWHQITCPTAEHQVLYSFGERREAAAMPVFRVLSPAGLRFSVQCVTGVTGFSLQVETPPGVSFDLSLDLSRFDLSGPDMVEYPVLSSQAQTSTDGGVQVVEFNIPSNGVREPGLYSASLRILGGMAADIRVWGSLIGQGLPVAQVERLAAHHREPLFGLEWCESGARFRQSTEKFFPLPEDRAVLPIHRHSTVSFSFEAPAASLAKLQVGIAPRIGRGTLPLQMELFDENGELLALRAIRPLPVPETRYAEFDLEGFTFRPGTRYRVLLTSPTTSATSCNAVVVNRTALPEHRPRPEILLEAIDPLLPRYVERSASLSSVGADIRLAVALVVPQDHPYPARLLEMVRRALPGIDLRCLTFTGDWGGLLAELLRKDVVLLADVSPAPGAPTRLHDEVMGLLHASLVTTIFLDTQDQVASLPSDGLIADSPLSNRVSALRQTARRCHQIARPLPNGTLSCGDSPLTATGLPGLRQDHLRQVLPHIAVVTVLYQKAATVEQFLDCLNSQSYGGRISVVLVDDASTDDGASRVENWAARHRRSRLSVTLIRQTVNQGNCAARNIGIAAVHADAYVVIDCDCLLNGDFLAAHALELSHPDVDVVVGPLNIESHGRAPEQLIAQLQGDAALLKAEMAMQDRTQLDGFVNCITRNMSVRATLLRQVDRGSGPFDLDLSYSARPGSGFGWEDVDLGYRLHQAGARVKFTTAAISVHMSHPSSIDEAAKSRGLMRNFNLLMDKHPDLPLVARRWAVATAKEIMAGAVRARQDAAHDYHRLRQRFAAAIAAPAISQNTARPLRILSYRWHCGHQYELYKLPHEFTLVRGLGPGMTDAWSYDQRPLRSNVNFIDAADIKESRYDLAILHFDENSLNPALGAGVLPLDWGRSFRWFLDNIKLPKVAICHGTVPFVGQYNVARGPIARFELMEAERQAVVDKMRAHDVEVVVNAHAAQAEWGFHRSRVIWHGFDPQEYRETTRRRDVLALGASMWERPHYRGAFEHEQVLRHLPPGIVVETASNEDGGLWARGTNDYAWSRFRSYAARIAEFTAYLDTSRRSPMPRSRGEAMLSGVVPVGLESDDLSLFIHHGVNGFIGDQPEELAEYLAFLCRNGAAAARIGTKARQTALDLFNHDRYLAAWSSLLAQYS